MVTQWFRSCSVAEGRYGEFAPRSPKWVGRPRFDLMQVLRLRLQPPAMNLVHSCLPLNLNSLQFLKKTQSLLIVLRSHGGVNHSGQNEYCLAHCTCSLSADCKNPWASSFIHVTGQFHGWGHREHFFFPPPISNKNSTNSILFSCSVLFKKKKNAL